MNFIYRIRPSIKISLFIIGLLMFGIALYYFRINLAQGVLPWLYFCCDLFEWDYHIAELDVRQHKREWVFYLRLVSDQPVQLYGHFLPKMDVSAQTLVTHFLQHTMIFLSAALAALLFIKPRWRLLWPCLILAFLISIGLDIPFTLLGSIDGLILQTLAPDLLNKSIKVTMERIMNNGGRLGLSISLGLICLSLCSHIDLFDYKVATIIRS
jgi:hypothetical protein